MTANELNESLSSFVREILKPNGSEYAPDTIYYLCLSIQQYLNIHGKTNDIFHDKQYEKFTDHLNVINKKYLDSCTGSYSILARVREEHLWETKQLGVYSPQTLLNTLIYFNTKYFGIDTIDEHMQLSFLQFEKCSDENSDTLIYAPLTSVREAELYELHANRENVFRCPVTVHAFYLSKCPQSVNKSLNFYLQPEAGCPAAGNVWYSTTALPKKALEKMLNRIKIVKETAITCNNN